MTRQELCEARVSTAGRSAPERAHHDYPAQADFVRRHLAALGGWLELPDLASSVEALVAHDDLKLHIEAMVQDVAFFRTKRWEGLLALGLYRVTLYALTRALNATSVIETGVLHGLSSIFILQAMLESRGRPRLISIDCPSTYRDGPSNRDGFTDTLPPGQTPGWIIGDLYRDLWDLRLGRSVELLRGAVAQLGTLDLFIHDSEHTDETMTFEFETTWPALRCGGLLVADNIDANTAFFDFSRAVQRVPFVMPRDPDQRVPGGSGIRFGLIRK